MVTSEQLKAQILTRENVRIYKENCDIKQLNACLIHKLKTLKGKVETLLSEMGDVEDSGVKLLDVLRPKGRCETQSLQKREE